MFIESQRLLLEEIDTIEHAVAARFKKYPHLYPGSSSQSTKRSHKETLLQQHELAFLQNKYASQCASFLANRAQTHVLRSELASLSDFAQFDRMLEAVKNQDPANEEPTNDDIMNDDTMALYAMYSSAPAQATKTVRDPGNKRRKRMVQKRHVLSTAASHLSLESMFSEREYYGKYLDLLEFYHAFQALQSHTDLTYVEYLRLFDKFPYDNVDQKSPHFRSYIRRLLAYLTGFHAKVRPFNIEAQSPPRPAEQSNAEQSAKLTGHTSETPPSAPNSPEVYCAACDKTFAKNSVYQGHLSGKKHQKNITKAHPSTQDVSLQLDELKIAQLAEKLAPIREATISNNERKAALTERERMLEDLAVAGDESEYTTADESSDNDNHQDNDDDDDDDDDNMNKDLPLGVDGKPIPYWLYKLQGLNRTYECEICSNTSYKGRALFFKHFGGAKHQHGLRCLGIDDEHIPIFKNITMIDEAVELWKRIKKEKRVEENQLENAVEVEDEDGNVISEKDYLELKRQGLL